MKQLLHIASRKAERRVWTPLFLERLRQFGELTVIEDGDGLSDEECAGRIRRCHVVLTSWGARPVPPSLADDRGQLEYVCHVTGTVRQFVPLELIEAGIPVTNWGDAAANPIAEGAMLLLLAMARSLRHRIEVVQRDGWRPEPGCFSATLDGMNVGIYGYGYIGERFVEMLRPFRAVMRIYDPYVAEVPDDCIRVGSLEELFEQSEAIVIHAGLSDETRGSVTAELLAKLPDNGIIVNTARGGIIAQDALFAELEKGRLLAGLDVLDPDRLPDGHPAKQWPNVIFTAHNIGASSIEAAPGARELQPMHLVCLENLKRHVSGEPLKFVLDRERYLRST